MVKPIIDICTTAMGFASAQPILRIERIRIAARYRVRRAWPKLIAPAPARALENHREQGGERDQGERPLHFNIFQLITVACKTR
jgi:hypothetical protein